jgi:hypothetical protein
VASDDDDDGTARLYVGVRACGCAWLCLPPERKPRRRNFPPSKRRTPFLPRPTPQAVQQAISEKAGTFLQHFATFLAGYALAFAKGWVGGARGCLTGV